MLVPASLIQYTRSIRLIVGRQMHMPLSSLSVRSGNGAMTFWQRALKCSIALIWSKCRIFSAAAVHSVAPRVDLVVSHYSAAYLPSRPQVRAVAQCCRTASRFGSLLSSSTNRHRSFPTPLRRLQKRLVRRTHVQPHCSRAPTGEDRTNSLEEHLDCRDCRAWYGGQRRCRGLPRVLPTNVAEIIFEGLYVSFERSSGHGFLAYFLHIRP